MRQKKTDRLSDYRSKRSADRTPEPFSEGTSDRSRLFVVQKHAARNMHFDLRLQMGGALHSWAVPRGPSLDPAVKRLAVEVEEHPLEYADFEGLIPEGNYGAGAVIVWDRGQWVPIGDPEEGLVKGKLLFDLRGYKLHGRWTLFRTKGKANEWLLVKKPDAEASADAELSEQSIRSGLTVEELRDGVDPTAGLLERIGELAAPRGRARFQSMKPMLAQAVEKPFSRPGWLFELKYDGFRLLAERDGAAARLRYRKGQDATASFPEIADVLGALPCDSMVLDGEVVVLDDAGKPSFSCLQQRVHLTRTADIRRATVSRPATFFVFDLPFAAGFDLRKQPLVERKRLLERLLPRYGPLRYCDHIEEQGEAMFEEVRRMRLEGVVAKRAESAYVSARSADWLKIRADRTGDFVVAGFSAAKGTRSGFGALHLAVHEPEGLVYAGRVGSGFTDRQLDELREELEGAGREDPPCSGPSPTGAGHRWVEPHRVCEVRFKEWTPDGLLRQPVFLRMLEDRSVEDCVRVDPVAARGEPPPIPRPEPAERKVSFTNLQKVFWPVEGYTKGDLLDYHRAIAPHLLVYLRDRPLVLTRYPDGIEGKNFFQKDAPGFVPDWIRTEKMWSEHARREIHYFIAEDVETLLYLINLGTIPLHLWASRIASLQYPDWCILDLDPKQAPFEHVIEAARCIRKLCNEIDLPCFVKTSGSSGLHVLVPLGGQCTFEQSRALGELLARTIVGELPEITTVTRATAARGGRVYIDYLQNGHGRLLVSPFSVRPLAGAPVSTPLRWSEVRRGLDIRKFTIKNVPSRLRRAKHDPLGEVLTSRPDLPAALERLSERLDSGGS